MAFISPIFLQISLCRRIAKTCNRSKGVVFGVSEKCDPDTLRWENGVKRCVFMLQSYFKNGNTTVWVIINMPHRKTAVSGMSNFDENRSNPE